jgi:D-alanyl-D-alanine carboxypeptidase (penicillin-binding protein 5/6)
MSHRQAQRTGRRLLYLLGLVIICLGIFNYARPLPRISASPAPISSSQGTISLDWPTDGASAAIGAAGYGVLATQSDIQLPTASIAKIITALTVLKVKPLTSGQQGPNLTITAQDVAIYNNYVAQDGSVVPVTEGETMTEYQALQAMLLPSANNIADALAIWAYGSLTNYQTAATQEVALLGLQHTTIGTDASGLAPSTTSTPSDLVLAGANVMTNPVLSQIVNEPSAELPVAGTVYNVNGLLGDDGINGVKTGNSDQAGGNFLFSAPYSLGGHSVTIIGAIMHAPDLQTAMQDSIPLLNSVKQGFTLATAIKSGQTLGTYQTPWGEKVTAVAQKDVDLIAWQGTTLTPHVSLKSLIGGLAAGSQVGTVTVSSNKFAASGPIILKTAYVSPSFWWRLTRH